jgi:hypothetical protein
MLLASQAIAKPQGSLKAEGSALPHRKAGLAARPLITRKGMHKLEQCYPPIRPSIHPSNPLTRTLMAQARPGTAPAPGQRPGSGAFVSRLQQPRSRLRGATRDAYEVSSVNVSGKKSDGAVTLLPGA